MKRVDVSIEQAAPDAGAILIFPKPFQYWNQRFVSLDLENLDLVAEVQASNSNQNAYIAKPSNGAGISIGYGVKLEEAEVTPSVWNVESNRYTTADLELVNLARDIASDAKTEANKVRALIEYAAKMFGYDHPEEHFYDGMDKVPAVCGTTKGNCVDINTFLLSAALSLGIKGQYIAGFWFHPDKNRNP